MKIEKTKIQSVELAKKRLVAIFLAWGTEAGGQEHYCLTGWLKREMLVLVQMLNVVATRTDEFTISETIYPRLYVMLVHSISLQDILTIKLCVVYVYME